MSRPHTLLAIDPSLAAPGYAVLDLSRAEPRLVAAGVWETKRADASKRKSVFEDNMRRGLFIKHELERVIALHSPKLIAVEAAGGSQSANAMASMMISQTVVLCLVDQHLQGGRPIYITALEASTALGVQPTQRTKRGEPAKTSRQKSQDKKARKAAIARAVVERFGTGSWQLALGLGSRAMLPGEVLDPDWEGAHDAAAVGLAAWELPEVAALRMIARQTSIPGTETHAAP